MNKDTILPTFETVENVPEWAISYLYYGDESALTEQDKADADAFVAKLAKDGLRLVSPIDGTENDFCHCPAFGLACSTIDWTAERIKNES